MTTERDPRTRIVLSWLREDAYENPERMLLRALDEVDATPQRRSWWPAWRSNRMNIYAKLAAGAVAVLVVALVGYQILPSNTGSGGLPTPTAAPSPTPEPTPEPTAVALPQDGPIDAGRYRVGSGPTFVVTVPTGWVSTGMGVRKNLDQADEVALNAWVGDIQVFADACQSADTEASIGPTGEELLTALRAQQNSSVSDPVAVTVGGHPATRLEISAAPGVDAATCSIGSLQIWHAERGGYLAGMSSENSATVYIVDTPGGRLVFSPHHDPAATAADIAELDAIVASIAIVE